MWCVHVNVFMNEPVIDLCYLRCVGAWVGDLESRIQNKQSDLFVYLMLLKRRDYDL